MLVLGLLEGGGVPEMDHILGSIDAKRLQNIVLKFTVAFSDFALKVKSRRFLRSREGMPTCRTG